jgi:hypothetical protein
MQQHGRLVIHSSKGAAREIVEGGVDGLAVDPENISRLAYLDPALRQNRDRLIDELQAKPERGIGSV